MQQGQSEPEQKSKLPLALGIAVGVAILMTVLSVMIYTFGGFYKLDLSRPGYEIEREDVSSNEAAQTYDSTSALSREAVDEILQTFDRKANNLNVYGDFNNDSLDDENILTGQ